MKSLTPTAVIVLAVAVYVLPGLIAVAREHRRPWAVLAVNLLIGWTIFGWIGALIWACRSDAVHRQETAPMSRHANDNSGESENAGDHVGHAGSSAPETPAKVLCEPPRLDPYADWLEDGAASVQDASPDRRDDLRPLAGRVMAA